MRFIDSHVHLSEYEDTAAWTAFAGFSKTTLLSSGIDRDTSLATIQLADLAGRDRDFVKAFVGCHPSEAKGAPDLAWFEEALGEATGAGELGLDPSYPGFGPKGDQMVTFVRQLEVLEKSGKPLQVHSRGGERQCLDTLSSYRLGTVLMHWFEAEEELEGVRDKGYYVSFGPALVYSKKLQRMVLKLDSGHVLAESDGPVTFKALGGAGGPALIPTVVFKMAEIWREPFPETRERVLQSSLDYLSGSGKT